MSFGYIGSTPSQSDTSNSGVMSLKEHNKLKDDFKLAGGYFVDYLVVAGGAGGGSGHQNGGAGGGGGMRSTVDNKGGIAGTETGFYAPSDVKKLSKINMNNDKGIIVGNNNDLIQYFKRIK